MNLGSLSINRPILAMVLSIVLLIVGAIAYTTLPVAEYPQVAPPTVVVTTQYPGASAQTVSDTVATPIEQEINGVEDMLYVYSQATSNGQLTITVTFKLGTDLDKAQVLVQNRVAIAQPRLPEEVQRIGVVTRKNSPDLMMVVFMLSPDDTYDQLYISNYALRQVRDPLLRLDGIGDITIFGARDYSMRLWLDPDKIATLGMTAGDVLAAIRAQNLQIAGGQIAEPPIADRAFQPNLTFTGRLKTIGEFENIVIKAGTDGRTTRLRDVARIELGALSSTTNGFLLRKEAVAMLVYQRPGSNALSTAKNIEDAMVKLKADFPKGLDYNIGYNPTEFIAQSVSELVKTIYEAMVLVVIVVLVFLQGWRPAIIPIVAIPVSLVGTFAIMAALGFSINNLTLFGLVLAVGRVGPDPTDKEVDDASLPAWPARIGGETGRDRMSLVDLGPARACRRSPDPTRPSLPAWKRPGLVDRDARVASRLTGRGAHPAAPGIQRPRRARVPRAPAGPAAPDQPARHRIGPDPDARGDRSFRQLDSVRPVPPGVRRRHDPG